MNHPIVPPHLPMRQEQKMVRCFTVFFQWISVVLQYVFLWLTVVAKINLLCLGSTKWPNKAYLLYAMLVL